MRGRLLAGLCLCATLGFAGGAQACSCAPASPAQSMQDAQAAVVGRLVRVIPHGTLRAVYRYEVRHVYKGQNAIRPGRTLDVLSARRSAACALPRRANHSYGLFLHRAHGRWYGGICGVVSPRRLRHAALAGSAADSPRTPALCG